MAQYTESGSTVRAESGSTVHSVRYNMSNGEKHMVARLGALKKMLSVLTGPDREMLVKEIEHTEKMYAEMLAR
jgi:hypothetical protein